MKMPHIDTTQTLKDERGQTMAELALVLPVLLVLLLGIAQFGVTFNNYVSLTDAVRAGARKGAVSRNLADPAGACRAQVIASAGSLDTTELGRNLSCTYSAFQPGADVTVTADYPYDIRLLDWTVLSGRFTSTMKERLE
jgi:Flp pilus assembly protein TadG